MDYKIENIINEDDRKELIATYNSLPSGKAHQDYNLFDVDKRPIGGTKREIPAFEKLDAYAGLPPHGAYFVMYEEESFTRIHTDDDAAIGMTTVTLLDTSPDLEGGETVILLPYTKTSRPIHKYRKGNAPEQGRPVIPVVVPCGIGQTMVYDNKLSHSVAQVRKGKRLVLVQWYYKDEETRDKVLSKEEGINIVDYKTSK